MNMIVLWILMSGQAAPPDKTPIYPFPPVNPCSNPVKCTRQRPTPVADPMRRPLTQRIGRGPYK
jgi:hypothetical protein